MYVPCVRQVEGQQQLTVHIMDCKLLLFCHNYVCLVYAVYVMTTFIRRRMAE